MPALSDTGRYRHRSWGFVPAIMPFFGRADLICVEFASVNAESNGGLEGGAMMGGILLNGVASGKRCEYTMGTVYTNTEEERSALQ